MLSLLSFFSHFSSSCLSSVPSSFSNISPYLSFWWSCYKFLLLLLRQLIILFFFLSYSSPHPCCITSLPFRLITSFCLSLPVVSRLRDAPTFGHLWAPVYTFGSLYLPQLMPYLLTEGGGKRDFHCNRFKHFQRCDCPVNTCFFFPSDSFASFSEFFFLYFLSFLLLRCVYFIIFASRFLFHLLVSVFNRFFSPTSSYSYFHIIYSSCSSFFSSISFPPCISVI